MRTHIYKIVVLAITTLLAACSTDKKPSAEIVVSIEPLKYLVEQITNNQVEVAVLVPAGASPETYDPSPRQIAQIEDAKLLLTTGLIEFENNLLKRVGDKQRVINLSNGIELIGSAHEHSHEGESHEEQEHSAPAHAEESEHKHSEEADGEEHPTAHHAHHHGVDPHIWTSPRELKKMAQNAYEAITAVLPTKSYEAGYESLIKQIDDLDAHCQELFERSGTKAFVVYHPALTYLARAYGLEQIAIEEDGKEPSARDIARIIDRAREQRVKVLLYQVEYPRSMVDIVARDMGVEPKQINPLDENPIRFIEQVTGLITGE